MKILTTREFHFVRVDFYVDSEDSSEFWVTREQIGNLLGYFKTPEESIRQLHEMYHEHLRYSFIEAEINTRSKDACTSILYNSDGLIQLCVFSGKKRTAELVNFFWEMKREFEGEKSQENLPALQKLSYGKNQMRMIKQNDEYWFVADDICTILGFTNSREAINSLAGDEKSTLRFSDGTSKLGGKPNINIINEPGVYRLVLRSNKPKAEPFKRWIFHEVLPSLRKTGSYSVKSMAMRMLTGKFYTPNELAAELGLCEYDIVTLALDNDLLMYIFTEDGEWYFTEEGREKMIEIIRR